MGSRGDGGPWRPRRGSDQIARGAARGAADRPAARSGDARRIRQPGSEHLYPACGACERRAAEHGDRHGAARVAVLEVQPCRLSATAALFAAICAHLLTPGVQLDSQLPMTNSQLPIGVVWPGKAGLPPCLSVSVLRLSL